MNVPFSPPDMTEQEANLVKEAILSGWITTGPKTKEFERLIASYCGTQKAVCLNSATACMESILRVLGVGPGDEVITSAYTYTASASVIYHVGAKIVLVDTKPGSFEMDYQQLADSITERTIIDGRDVNVRFPNADYSFYLTASELTRVSRMHSTKEEVASRDMWDLKGNIRKSNKLIEIDTDNKTVEEITNEIINIIGE
jgi:histidinol-phosphate/aromatic aminotransferase/cobyric acid decarboxylase-like protein